jgi:transcriptional regulator with XRE-family HTH domain
MPWETLSMEKLAASLGVDINEVREKHRLIDKIIEIRIQKKLSQAKLAKMAKVTQGRIAQIESGIGTSNITFDVLFRLLDILGYKFKIVPTKKAA